jgi:hypothetical protein
MRASGTGLGGGGRQYTPRGLDDGQRQAAARHEQYGSERATTLAPFHSFPCLLPEDSFPKDTDCDQKRTDREIAGPAYH